jgi:peptide/nickel transport system substrate-binding protein
MRLSSLACWLAIAVVACSSTESASSDGNVGGTVVVAAGSDAGDLVPPFVNDATGRAVSDLIYDRLAEISQDLTTLPGDRGFTPRLARSWTWAADSLSIAFSIDPRARWHDGQPVRASDVRFTYQLVVNPKAPNSVAVLLANIDSVQVRDSTTAVVWYKHRTPEQFYEFVYQLPIIPEHVFGSIAPDQLRTADATRRPVGSGRFRFVRWDAGSRIELVADTANYRGRAKLDRVIFSVARDPATAVTQVLGGQTDFFEIFPSDQLGNLDSSTVARPVPTATLGYTHLNMSVVDRKAKNRPHPIFGEKAVRRALSMAVDRSAMLQNVFGKYGHIGHGPFPASVASSDTTLRLLPFDVAAAKALLDSAGWRESAPGGVRAKGGRPLRFSLMYPTSSINRGRYAVLLQQQLRQVGAQVDLEPLEPRSAFFPRMFAGDYDAAIHTYNTDPGLSAARQAWSSAGIGQNGQNYGSYANPAVDRLLDSAAMTFDLAKSRSYMSRAYQQIVEDAPSIWLYDNYNVAGVHRRIEIAPLRPDGWWSGLADWSIPAEKRIDRDRIGLAQPAR